MIDSRVFIVGCPRSGTTLLQSMLHSHPSIYSLPETKFFTALIGIDRRAYLREAPRTLRAKVRALARDTLVKFGLVERHRQIYAWRVIRDVARRSGWEKPIGCSSFLISHHTAAFVHLLDALALASRKSIWLEKSTDHLFYIPQIARLVPHARFIHIIRDGKDNVASLVDAAQKYPSDGWEEYKAVEVAVRLRNIAVQESQKYRNDISHYFVRYEHLALNPRETLKGVCEFLGCHFDERMVTNYTSAASDLIHLWEHWKSGNRDALSSVAPSKYLQIFDAAQRAYIEKTLVP